MVLFDDFWGVHVAGGFPSVIACWVPLPLDEILQGFVLPKELIVDNHFNLKLLICLHEVRGRLCEVWTV